MIRRIDNAQNVIVICSDLKMPTRFEARPKVLVNDHDALYITLTDNTRKVGQSRTTVLYGNDILALRDLLNQYFPQEAKV